MNILALHFMKLQSESFLRLRILFEILAWTPWNRDLTRDPCTQKKIWAFKSFSWQFATRTRDYRHLSTEVTSRQRHIGFPVVIVKQNVLVPPLPLRLLLIIKIITYRKAPSWLDVLRSRTLKTGDFFDWTPYPFVNGFWHSEGQALES